MPTLALVHTSPTLAPLFNELTGRLLPDARVLHFVDESLIKNTIAAGILEKATIRRAIALIGSTFDAGADVALVTCSSIGPAVDAAATMISVPVLRVDQPMADRAVATGRRIGVVATLPTTLEPTAELIRRRAKNAGREIELTSHLCEGAFDALMSGDAPRHDAMVAKALAGLASRVDVIVLAQASMARVVDALPAEDKPVPILSSPRLAVEHLATLLNA